MLSSSRVDIKKRHFFVLAMAYHYGFSGVGNPDGNMYYIYGIK